MTGPEQPRLPFLDNGVAQGAIPVPDIDEAVRAYWELYRMERDSGAMLGRPAASDHTVYCQPAGDAPDKEFRWQTRSTISA